MKENNLTEQKFTDGNTILAAKGMLLSEGTDVQATVSEAPSSTKNKDRTHDPEMKQTKKGKSNASE